MSRFFLPYREFYEKTQILSWQIKQNVVCNVR